MMENTRTDPIAINPRPAKAATQESGAAPPEEKESFRGRNIKVLIFSAAGILIIGIVVAAALFLGWISLPGSSSAKKKEVVPPAAAIGPMLKINPLVINLREEGGRHYIKTTIILEIGRPEWLEEVRSKIPLLADLTILTLSDKRLKELQDAEAKENLKKELLLKTNQALGSAKVTQIYFDEFLLQ
jgi:flagellar basal body-associated protein FliL